MKKVLFFLLSALLTASVYSQTLTDSVEAETGVLTGVTIAPPDANSSGSFVTGFDSDGDQVTVNVTVPVAGDYSLVIRYRSVYGDKKQNIYVNNVYIAETNFPLSATFADINAATVTLSAGVNTVTVVKSWGYMDVDKLSIYTTVPVPPHVYNIPATLIDGQANTAALNLYSFLLSQFGKRIISGSTDGYYDSLKAVTGKSPVLRAWDMASYSPMYAYKWSVDHHVFGAVDNQDAEKAIAWYNGTGKKGIVSFHWHWHSPSGGTAGTNTFYTNQTSFDISQAVISGTQQNTDVLRDIDAIAVQLKKLRDADVPVLWRPLHEAGGGWFWWGAKGSAPAKALWDIMYDRLTNYHQLHNLIWVWSTPEADWYPGNAKVDMIGYDSYPGAFNYTTQKNIFDDLFDITGGEKMITMSENGPIPDIQNSFTADAPWSYFMSWNELVFSQNSTQHIMDVYANPQVLTLENYASALPIVLSGYTALADGQKAKIQWNTSSEQNNDRFEIERSSNGKDFYKLATVKGRGNTSASHAYFVYDNNPASGVNYYRLIQYNYDGKKTDYGVKSVRFATSDAPSVKAYPNPSHNVSGLLLSNYKGKTITAAISDMSGKVVYKQIISTGNGQGYYALQIGKALAAGQYILLVTGEDLQESIKLIIK